MTLTAELREATLSAESGSSVATDILIRNRSTDTVEVRLTVTGPGRPFSWLAPDTLSVGGGSEGVARVGFHLPRAALPPAGPLPFDVTITGPAGAVTLSGTVEVRPFALLSAILSPPQSGRYDLTLTNRGNAPVTTTLGAEFPAEALDVGIEPTSLVVDSGGSAHAAVHVQPRRAGASGDGSPVGFRVVAEPSFGAPVTVAAECDPLPARRRRGAMVVGIVAAVLVLAGAVAFAVNSGGSDGGNPQRAAPTSNTEPAVGDAAVGGPLDPCPAKGQPDRFGVRGLQPHEIALLPDTSTFLRVKPDGCSPMRFNPCEPIHYVQNAAAAPPFAAENVREAFRRLAQATGMTFVDDGLTDENARTGPYVPERYGNRWAPILIVWEHFPAEQTTGESQVFGQTVIYRVDDVVVSGRLRFNVDAYNDEFTKAPIEAGFGPPAGSGTGAIGRHNVQWGRIVLHELAHLVGLGHNRNFGSLMYPDAAQHATRPAGFSRMDLEGLRYLGREAGCIPTPPVRPV